MDETFVTVARFRDTAMAELAKSMLVAAGIECRLQDEETIAVNWLWSNALGGVKVQVEADHAEEARALLNQDVSGALIEGENTERDAERCPRCGSTRVQEVDGRRRAAAAMLLWMNFIPIVTRHWSRHHECSDCGFVWQTKPVPRRELHSYADVGPLRPSRSGQAGWWFVWGVMALAAAWMATR